MCKSCIKTFPSSPFIVFGAMIMAFTVNVKAALVFVIAIPLLSVVVFGIMLSSVPLYKKVQGKLDTLLFKNKRKPYRGPSDPGILQTGRGN